MSYDNLMYTASSIYFICYLPEFYANYINKNANLYNVFEKILMLIATTFALSYAILINNNALILNYTPIIILDIIALSMRSYYALKNRKIDVRITHNLREFKNNYNNVEIVNPIHE
jgi:uncharacterized protein with PQ loop repeat